MRALLDTHTLLWAVDNPSELGAAAAATLQDSDNELLLSAATIWEIAIKIGLSKLTLSLPYRQWITTAIADLKSTILPITVAYAEKVIQLPFHHRDPFDRLLVAQAMAENVPLISADTLLERYGIQRIWD